MGQTTADPLKDSKYTIEYWMPDYTWAKIAEYLDVSDVRVEGRICLSSKQIDVWIFENYDLLSGDQERIVGRTSDENRTIWHYLFFAKDTQDLTLFLLKWG